MQELRGTGVALATPFNEDLSVDFDGLAKLIDYNIDGGVDYLVVMGTTAENATLTAQEKDAVIKKAIEVNAGRLPLVLGVGGNNTAEVINELKERDLSAFKAILSVSPYYNKPTQAGIFAHYEAVATATSLPIILYNVPGRTGSNMLP
ncbi:MAG TPA: 4-hydroxy-tetrahydrodipicolinate synthase, partial [Leeuwenhoekiella sp.]|nr:4-hydroxy-tetrahydrodipicolinate synthase [Leeuwenhoekiella sp.]